jgi:predicted nucleic acid-binding Zn ribbon protein
MAMSHVTVPVSFTCKKCGGNTLELPDNPSDDSIAICKSCQTQLGRWGEIKAAAAHKVGEAAVDSMRESLKKAFSGSDIKFK